MSAIGGSLPLVIEIERRIRTAAPGDSSGAPPSARVLETAAMFGLGVDEERELAIVPRTAVPLPCGGVVFITGPSGGGKSTVLGLIAAACRALGKAVIDVAQLPLPRDEPLVDQIGSTLGEACSMLALAGLGDAFVMMRRPGELSDGQRHRFALARAFEAASKANPAGGAVMLADEFGASLDRLTARALAAAVRKWIARTPHTLVAATTHDDLLEALVPQVLIHKGLGERIDVIAKQERESRSVVRTRDAAHGRREQEVHGQRDDATGDDDREADCGESFAASSRARGGQERAGRGGRGDRSAVGGVAGVAHDGIVIEPGTPEDYRALADFHYRSHHVGAATRVVRAVVSQPSITARFRACDSHDAAQPADRVVAGVLVLCLPHLGCGLRDYATRGRYRLRDRAAAATMLNREVRSISRVVVDPRWRGLGLAVRLVRWALDHPDDGVVFTESLAAMGRVHPFFERAGMTRYDRPPGAEQARLVEALARLGLEAAALASPRAARAAIGARSPDEQLWIEGELRRWQRRAGGTRSRKKGDQPVDDLLNAARDRLLSRPVYFLFAHAGAASRETLALCVNKTIIP